MGAEDTPFSTSGNDTPVPRSDESEEQIWHEVEAGQVPKSVSLDEPWLFGRHMLSPEFWHNRTSWPRSSNNAIFLGEAVLDVGQAMFPAEWKEGDIFAERTNSLQIPNPAQERVVAVCSWIVEQALANVFATYTCDPDALELARLPAIRWGRSNFGSYFWKCSVETIATTALYGPPQNLIFLDALEFRRAISQLGEMAPPLASRRRGRPEKYPWSEIKRNLDDWIAEEGLPDTQAACETRVAQWFAGRGLDEPQISTIRKHVGPIYQKWKAVRERLGGNRP